MTTSASTVQLPTVNDAPGTGGRGRLCLEQGDSIRSSIDQTPDATPTCFPISIRLQAIAFTLGSSKFAPSPATATIE